MKINGLYFNKDDAKQMLKDIEARLPNIPKAKRIKIMAVVELAMEQSACHGVNGMPDVTSTLTANGYQVTANVCCGGYAEVSISKSDKIL